MKALVTYFSAGGVTAGVAGRLAQAVGAPLYEIRPEVPYTAADLDWRDKNSRSTVEMKDKSCRPALADGDAPVADAGVIFVGFPVWWYREPSIVDSFLGAYVEYPELCEGIRTESVVFPERTEPSPLHADPTLVIDRLTVTPEVISDLDEPFTVTAWTRADPARIEEIYFVHPSKAQMPVMTYRPEKGCWEADNRTGTRALNIFCNTKITARIRGKDGGVGPAAEIPVEIRYDAQKKD